MPPKRTKTTNRKKEKRWTQRAKTAKVDIRWKQQMRKKYIYLSNFGMVLTRMNTNLWKKDTIKRRQKELKRIKKWTKSRQILEMKRVKTISR